MTPGILGVNVRSYPTECKTWDGCYTSVAVVLVAGTNDDYAAYAGCGTPEWVARHGDKVTFDEACIHFPGGQLDRERYRD